MRIEFTAHGWADPCHWLDADPAMADRIRDLIADIKRDPFKGLGEPEPLRHHLAGFWSRRINGEHRSVHALSGTGPDQRLIALSCRFHYDQ